MKEQSEFGDVDKPALFSIQETGKSLCTAGKKLHTLCADQHCQQSPILCIDQQCSCQTPHSDCVKIVPSSILRKAKSKIICLKAFQAMLEDKFNQLIDELSDFKEKMIISLQTDLIYHGIPKNAQLTYEGLLSGKTDQLKGSSMWNLLKSISQKNDLQSKTNTILNICRQQCDQMKTNLQSGLAKIECLIKKLSGNNKVFDTSTIVSSKIQVERIQKYFTDKTIEDVLLLYRASENNFQVKSFWEQCLNIENTLLLIKTETLHIIGAFTPLEWYRAASCQSVPDEKLQSFLFSLTNDDKFVMRSKQDAIIRHDDKNYGPDYGKGRDLIVSDKANLNKLSHAKFNNTYFNEKYQNSPQSSRKFCGSEDRMFRVIQWEVWNLKFSQKGDKK